MLYWVLKWVLIGPWLWLLYRPKVEGLSHVPSRGAAIVASNHLSVSDSFFLPLVVRRQMTFIGKSDYFIGRGIKGAVFRWFFRGVGVIPVDRSGGRAAQAALDTGLEALARGELFGIYPEGTRSPDGRLYRGKTGVARLALESGASVIPVAMLNTGQLQPIGKRLPRLGRVHIRIGEPLDFSRYAGLSGERVVERAVTDEIMYALMELSGQDYIDQYAATVKSLKQQAAESRAAAEAARAQHLHHTSPEG